MVVGSFVPASCHVDVGVLEEEDKVMTLLVVSRMVTSRSMVDLDSAYGAEHEDTPFCCSYRVIILFWHVWVDEISYVFSFTMYLFRFFL